MKLNELPTEIIEHIYHHVYPPWHLRYTQEHDLHEGDANPYNGLPIAISRAKLFGLYSQPLFYRLPSISAILVNKRLNEIGTPIYKASFTGQTNLTSYVKWATIHPCYMDIMARTVELVLDIGHLWSFNKLKLGHMFPALKKLLINDHVIKHGLDVEVVRASELEWNNEGPYLEMDDETRKVVGCGEGDQVVARSSASKSLYDVATIIRNYTMIQHENMVFRTQGVDFEMTFQHFAQFQPPVAQFAAMFIVVVYVGGSWDELLDSSTQYILKSRLVNRYAD